MQVCVYSRRIEKILVYTYKQRYFNWCIVAYGIGIPLSEVMVESRWMQFCLRGHYAGVAFNHSLDVTS